MTTYSSTLTAAVLMLTCGAAWAEHGKSPAMTQLSDTAGRAAAPILPPAGEGRPLMALDDDEEGRRVALRTCAKASFSSDRTACIREVNAARYLDPKAAAGCGSIRFSSNLPPCMAAIRDKTYIDEEVRLCSGNSFDDDRVTCFREGGRPYHGRRPGPRCPDSDSRILESLRRIRLDLQRGRVGDALATLGDLILYVEDGLDGPRHGR